MQSEHLELRGRDLDLFCDYFLLCWPSAVCEPTPDTLAHQSSRDTHSQRDGREQTAYRARHAPIEIDNRLNRDRDRDERDNPYAARDETRQHPAVFVRANAEHPRERRSMRREDPNHLIALQKDQTVEVGDEVGHRQLVAASGLEREPRE